MEKEIRRCQLCRHYENFGLPICLAFDVIPSEIYAGENNHSKPLKDQKNKIVFTPKRKKHKKKKRRQP